MGTHMAAKHVSLKQIIFYSGFLLIQEMVRMSYFDNIFVLFCIFELPDVIVICQAFFLIFLYFLL